MPDGSNRTAIAQSPFAVYQSQLGSKLVEDPYQLEAINALDRLFFQLTSQKPPSPEVIQGLYMWGDVGRGKTFLMDLFYDCLPHKGKMRLHFHRFMARIHQALMEQAGQEDPLILVANELAKECRILCFDEFFVSDIGDAMILAGLFERLFKQGVVLVATSNTPIERLYENGLARHKFLPCITLLQHHTQSVNLVGAHDHRIENLSMKQNEVEGFEDSKYIGYTNKIDFLGIFTDLTQAIDPAEIRDKPIKICHRNIRVIKATEVTVSNSVVWFDFFDLCEGPRSQLDYMEIATQFKTVLLSGVPKLGGQIRSWIKARGTEDGIGDNQAAVTGERIVSYSESDDMARRFISLIDELYDQKVRLYLGTDVPLVELYQEGALLFEFRRTYSRLIEMSRN
ncbi:MAG: cell division protein ZapE [Paraglaciecola sp.]|uniref:cell division protein ZapE n=1 Tax=Paraglaciecola sp. TaxID=1920173 RepID=UPI00329A29A0